MERIGIYLRRLLIRGISGLEEKIDSHINRLIFITPCVFFLLNVFISIAIYSLTSNYLGIQKAAGISILLFSANYVTSLFIFSFLVYVMELKRHLLASPDWLIKFIRQHTAQRLFSEKFYKIWITRDRRLIILSDHIYDEDYEPNKN